MSVKWKQNKNLKPNLILEKIKNITTVSNGQVSFSDVEYFNAMAALQSMIDFPSIDGIDKEYIVSQAISNIAKHGNIEKKKIIDEINNVLKNKLAKREDKYHILTHISLKPPYPAQNISIKNCKIRILSGSYPKKYSDREKLIEKIKSERVKYCDRNKLIQDIDSTLSNYAKVIVTLKAKSEQEAITKALRILDLQRGIWSLFGNSIMEIGRPNSESEPINKIRLGSMHTIHKENGNLATERYWYEPNYSLAEVFTPKNINVYKKNSKWLMKQLDKSSYQKSLKESLLRYVRALDERDQNVALIKLWGALESLTAPSEANYDMVTRRCSFLFGERNYHKQVLEHLREYRNSYIHAGDHNERSKHNCFQLQFYYYHLLLFHASNSEEFTTLDEANNFLDLSHDKSILENKKRLIEKAINFIQ